MKLSQFFCRSFSRFSTLLVVVILSTGCSSKPSLVEVSGTVKVGGKPATGAVVLLHPEDSSGLPASGVAEDDGTFKLVSGMEHGVPAGKYKVTITWPDPNKKATPQQMMMGTNEPGPDLLKGKYATRDKTTLTAEITSSTTSLPPFEL